MTFFKYVFDNLTGPCVRSTQGCLDTNNKYILIDNFAYMTSSPQCLAGVDVELMEESV